MAEKKKVKIAGKEYTLRKISGYELQKITSGLDDADATLKLLATCVEELDEETAKTLDPGPYLALAAELQAFLGLREADIKKFTQR